MKDNSVILDELNEVSALYHNSFENLQLNGRFSPHKNFVESLKDWCKERDKNFNVWKDFSDNLYNIYKKDKRNTASSFIWGKAIENKNFFKLF